MKTKLNNETSEWMTNLQETHNINIVNHDVQGPVELTEMQKHHINRVKSRLNYFKAKDWEKGKGIYAQALEATKKYVDVAKDALEFMERTGDTRMAGAIVGMLDEASDIYVSTVRILDEQYKLKRYTRRADCSLMSLAF